MDIKLPKLGESIVDATIVQWFKKEGDHVDLDEPLLEVATDKVNSEIPSPLEGIVTKILAKTEESVKVGQTLAVISSEQGEHEAQESKKPLENTHKESDNETFLSPAVMNLAKEAKLSLSELDRIPRADSGRLTKKDVEKYLAEKNSQLSCSASFEKVKMSPMRKSIADNLVKSFYEAPHATLINEVDITDLVNFISENKQAFQEKYSVKLSITAFFVKAIANAIKAYPLLNSSLEGDIIILKKLINLGIAVSIDNGVLVPIIKDCYNLKIHEIAIKIADLASKARSNSLAPDEVRNGTITMTNFGMAKVQIGIPIIRYPEVAIIGLGAITKKVKVLDDNSIGIRSMINICLTFDHRILDGMYGCSFLQELYESLKPPEHEI